SAYETRFAKDTFESEIENTSSESIVSRESFCFKLMRFPCEDPNGTDRSDILQSGYIDYGSGDTNMLSGGILQQIRLYGSFKLKSHTVVNEYVPLSDKKLQQVQTKVVDNYVLQLTGLKSSRASKVIKDFMLGNDIIISDYNMRNIDLFRN